MLTLPRSRPYQLSLLTVPLVESFCFSKALHAIGTIQHHYEDVIFQTGEAVTRSCSLPGLHSLPRVLQKDVRILPDLALFLCPLFIQNVASVVLAVHDLPEDLIVRSVHTQP